MPIEYQVQGSDCISSIAYDHGFFWETLWKHGSNSELKARRKDPNILKEGDVVHIPDLTLKDESGATEERHRFKLNGVPAKFRLRVLRVPRPPEPAASPAAPSPSGGGKDSLFEDPQPEPPAPDEPRANAPYILDIEGHSVHGQTDGEGMIECSIPPDARRGRLIIEPGTAHELILPLQLGHLNPVSELSGVNHRLANLGLGCGDLTDEPTPELAAALRMFQEKHGLPITGELDAATRDRLVEAHGS